MRAVRAPRIPIRHEHEVVDDQLAATGEELGQRLPALLALEAVFLPDRFPRQLAAQRRELITPARELFLLCEQGLACRQPLLMGYHAVVHGVPPVPALSCGRPSSIEIHGSLSPTHTCSCGARGAGSSRLASVTSISSGRASWE